jgi:hypothetical protein
MCGARASSTPVRADNERRHRPDLADHYTERANRFRARAEALRPSLSRWMSLGGLALVATTVVFLAVLLGSAPSIALAGVAAGLALFGFAFVRRARLEQAADDALRGWRVNANAEARCRDAWHSLPDDGSEFIDPTHPHSSDLDLFGPSSLFQFVSVAHTRHGRRALARFLSECVPLSESHARQQAVRRLVPELELRQRFETLTLSRRATPDAPAASLLRRTRTPAPAPRADTDVLLEWAEADAQITPRRALVWAARVLPALVAIAFVADRAFDAPSVVWKLGVALQAVLAFRVRRDIGTLFGIVGHWQGAFARLAAAFRAMAELPPDAPLLQQLRRAVDGDATSAQRELQRLDGILGWFALRNSEWAHPAINLLTSWDIHCAVALERWQRDSGPKLRSWLEALGQVETLSSLAGAAHDNPDFCFPELIEDPPAFIASGLGHPLLAPQARVDNDVSLPGPGHALLITGSNMSGKSTLLRAMGLASVLAMAGGPVCARRLRLAPVSVHTSLRVNDSLSDNVSHFYAELQRLRAMLAATRRPLPVFFLIDEILAGTNSVERGIGARWLLAELLRAGALGALSTHDGQLCQLPPELMQRVERVHFRESFEAGKLAFDYRLHAGPVQAGNALRLMRSMGLDVG